MQPEYKSFLPCSIFSSLSLGETILNKNKTQTAVTNMMKQRMLQKITNTIQHFIQEMKTKVTKYLSKGDIQRLTLYKRFPKIKDEQVKSRI